MNNEKRAGNHAAAAALCILCTALLCCTAFLLTSCGGAAPEDGTTQPEPSVPAKQAERDEGYDSGLVYTDGKREENDEEYYRRLARELAEQIEAVRKKEEERQAKIAAEKAALWALAPGFNETFASTLTEQEREEAEALRREGFVFYRQNWSVLKNLPYGSEGFGQCGCGPTCTAELIANLAGAAVTPDEIGERALESGCVLANGATSYDFILRTTAEYGITCTEIYAGDKETLFRALREGKLVLFTVGPGEFTLGSHFMLMRGVTEDGKVLISDSYSYEHTIAEWDYDRIYSQLKRGYWIFEKTG